MYPTDDLLNHGYDRDALSANYPAELGAQTAADA
jgi:hypothetical protein